MAIIDTNVAIERLRRGEEIHENITGVTFVEFPRIVRYSRFKGDVLFPNLDDYLLAHELQEKTLQARQSSRLCRFAHSGHMYQSGRRADNIRFRL
jgi:hypothetical protein